MSDTNDIQDAPVLEVSEEQRRVWDLALEKAKAIVAGHQITLPELLGLPQKYDPIPGMFFVRPKLGHKIELSRRTEAIKESGITIADAMEFFAQLFAPYARVQKPDGELTVATASELIFGYFEDVDDVLAFANHLISSHKITAEDADPNPPAPMQ